jgi:hypothetical protein
VEGTQLVCKCIMKYMKLDIKLCMLHPHPAPYPFSKTTRFMDFRIVTWVFSATLNFSDRKEMI